MALPTAFLIFFFVFLLLWGTNMTVIGLRRFARATHTGAFALSAVILALATSFPELSIAITSGIEGKSALSMGNVLGANIANLTLVAGGAALVAGRVVISGTVLRREIWIAGIAAVIPLGLLLDGILSRVDGLILIALWGAYVVHFFRIRFAHIAREFAEEGFWYRLLHRRKIDISTEREFARFLIGIAVLLFSADMIVRLAEGLAKDANLPLFAVGVVVIALGTTLPELVFSFRSLLARDATVFLGNILGSVIINSTLILGIASLISPVNAPTSSILKIGVAFIVIYLIFWFFIRTKRRLDRWEAAVLIGIYMIFAFTIVR